MFRLYVRHHARGWFSEVISWNRFSIRDLFSLSGMDNVLVPVEAFNTVLLIICRLLGLSSKILLTATHGGWNPFAETFHMCPQRTIKSNRPEQGGSE